MKEPKNPTETLELSTELIKSTLSEPEKNKIINFLKRCPSSLENITNSISKTYFNNLEIKKLTPYEIEILNLNKIVGISRFENELFKEEILCENISPYKLHWLSDKVDYELNNSKKPVHYIVVRANYELRIGSW